MVTKKPKISVIIPVYNVSQYIEECLESVVNQSLSDIEIICVDDCGDDDSVQKISKFKDSRIKLISHSQNKGLACARNTGMDAACGEYIFFLDSDDYLEVDALGKLYFRIKKTNADVACAKCLAFTDDSDEVSLKRVKTINKWLEYPVLENFKIEDFDFAKMLDNLNCAAWGKLYSAKFLKENNLRFINQNVIHEDNGFFIKVCSKFPLLTLTDVLCLHYRIRKNAITSGIEERRNRKRSLLHMKKNVDDALNFIASSNSPQRAQWFFEQIKNTMLYGNCFEKHFGLLYRFKWSRDDKRIVFLGIPLFREKRIASDKKNGKILGLKIYKTKIRPDMTKDRIDKNELGGYINKTCEPVLTKNKDGNLRNALNSLGSFYFLPNKGNGGDVLISFAGFQYLESYGYQYEVFDVANHKYNQPFNFLYSGGAIWIENYKDSYQEILEIFKSPLLQKCVILPSSFRNCPDLMEILDERFTVFCREQASFEYCKSANKKANFLLANDMVVDANFDIFKNSYSNSEYLQNFITNDDSYFDYISEKIYPFYRNCSYKLKSALWNIKTPNVAYLMRVDSEKAVNGLDILGGFDLSNLMGTYGCDEGLCFAVGKLFLYAINQFKVIVTDRLHVAICAAKLGKEVLMFDNSYGKLAAVYNYSLKDWSNIRFTSIETLSKDIEGALSKNLKETDPIKLPQNIYEFLAEYGSFQNKFGGEKRFW